MLRFVTRLQNKHDFFTKSSKNTSVLSSYLFKYQINKIADGRLINNTLSFSLKQGYTSSAKPNFLHQSQRGFSKLCPQNNKSLLKFNLNKKENKISNHIAFFHRNYRSNWYEQSHSSRLDEIDPDKLVKGLIGINIAVFVLIRLAYLETDPFKLKELKKWVRLNLAASGLNFKEGRLWTVFTSCFTHEDPWHLLSNLITLYFFAPAVAVSLGNRRFLQLYFASCLSASFFFFAYNQAFKNRPIGNTGLIEGDLSFSVGASGNAMAFLAYFGLKFPFETIYIYFFPIPAIVAVGGLFIYDYIRCRKPATHNGASVNHVAHLGGALSGVIFYILTRRPPPTIRPNAFGRGIRY